MALQVIEVLVIVRALARAVVTAAVVTMVSKGNTRSSEAHLCLFVRTATELVLSGVIRWRFGTRRCKLAKNRVRNVSLFVAHALVK